MLLKSEKVKLFIRHKKILRSAKKAQSSYEKDMPAKFITNESFFYQIDDKEILVLPRKKQDVLKLFSEKSNDIQNYAKKNRLSFKDKEDLIQLFKYYNTLN